MTGKYGGYDEFEFISGFYDTVYMDRFTRDVILFSEYSKKARGKTLELGCGTGRILIPTAEAGREITGLDLSPYMLKICQEKLSQKPEEVQKRVRLIKGNMTGFNTGEQYALVTIPLRTFQHLVSVDEQKACLSCVHKHLLPGGLLMIDIFNPSLIMLHEQKVKEQEDMPETELPDGSKVRRTVRTTAFNHEQQYNMHEFIYYITYPDGKKETKVQSFPFRYFFRYEFEHLLNICGFKVIELFGDFNRSEYSGNSPEMIFVARKM